MKITFVCSGNVFRSVFAEGYLKKLIAENKINNIEPSSCGTIAEPGFKIPKVLYTLFKVYDIKQKSLHTHIPTRITKEILNSSDLILVMDNTQLEFIKHNFKEFLFKTFLLKEYVGILSQQEIFDPIGQEETVYIKTAEEIKICLDILIKKFLNK
jgi:protein-tyrosine-phosphatase